MIDTEAHRELKTLTRNNLNPKITNEMVIQGECIEIRRTNRNFHKRNLKCSKWRSDTVTRRFFFVLNSILIFSIFTFFLTISVNLTGLNIPGILIS